MILIILTILGRADLGWAGSGLDFPEPIGAYLNGKLPSQTPQTGSGSWQLVDAFPGLSFTNPLFMTPFPGTNDLVMLEHHGLIFVFDNNPATTTKRQILDIRSRVQDTHWGGLLSLAFHPQFGQSGSPNREYVYMAYRYEFESGWASNIHYVPGYLRLSRFQYNFSTGQIDPNSELVMIQQYDASKHHLGGAITFGSDGFLYLSRGDEYCCNDPTDATQKLNVGFFSGMLRIDVDMNASRSHPIRRQPLDNTGNRPSGWPASFSQGYYIPNDNPWQDPSGGILEEFYAIGFRSPHVISYDAPTGNIWIADVGESEREEIDLLKKGANYQWPFREGNIGKPKSRPGTVIGTETAPVADYPHTEGANCIIGGHIYRGPTHAGTLGGKFLFADNGNQKVWAMTFNSGSGTGQIEQLCVGPSGGYYTGISGSGRDANGEVYFLKMTGHDDGNGKIMKLSRAGAASPEPPALLSQTGAFSNLATLQVSPGLLAYEVNTPMYSDASNKQRWFAIPNDGTHSSSGEKIGFSESGNWTFPPGAVLMKHFELPIDEQNPSLVKRMETRFMVQGVDGAYFGFTYRWRPDGSDADLLHDGLNESVQVRKANGTYATQAWRYPSRTECFACHSTAAGFVLGPRTRQLNRDQYYSKTGRTANQLETLNHLGIFSPAINPALLPGVLTSKPMGDAASSWQKRALSYLDSNCSHCHQPGGTAHANFDARLSTSPFAQGFVNANPNNNLGISGAKIIAPGDTARSVLYHRTNTLGAGAMPPIAKNHIDADAIALLENWIATIDPSITPPNPSTSDVTVPVPTLSAPGQMSGSLTVNVAFTEPVYGLTTDDFVITNGIDAAISGSGASYTLTVAATGGVSSVTVQLPSDKVIDAGSNANPPSNSVTASVASLPTLNIASASANESNGALTFTATLSAVSAAGISVQFSTVSGSATSPADFQHTTGTLTFQAGSTSATIQIPVVDDLIYETAETFTLQLSNASGATLGTASATGTIIDNDTAPSIVITDATTGENGWVLPFKIILSQPSAFPVTVFYTTVSNTATGGYDYLHAAETLTFQPGQTLLVLDIPIWQDEIDEIAETFYVRLSAPTNAVITDAEALGTIIDDDSTPSVTITGGTASESAGSIQFLVQLSESSGSPVLVSYATAERSATAGLDFTPASGSLTIPAGATSAIPTINLINDSIEEPNEDFAVNLSSPVNSVLGSSTAIGVIIDDDESPVVSVASVAGDESTGALTFAVSLSAASANTISVDYGTTSGTATAPDDFQPVSGTLTIPAGQTTASVPVTIKGDSMFEADETFTLALSGAVNATLGTASATGTIRDNDVAPLIRAVASSASERAGAITFRIYLSERSGLNASVGWTTNGVTAKAGTDFVASGGTAQILAGDLETTITVNLLNDDAPEIDETFNLALSNPENATLSKVSVTGTILDDDGAPSL
ncbi:MAG: PQQ-dependent sugar dehydrogenase, partial [Verrucomicrobia bacterium]|nr:PQQ-dependent sugar dehydrogenase [Verrucomicrobiota bacterium]